jgi:hypothetical protein
MTSEGQIDTTNEGASIMTTLAAGFRTAKAVDELVGLLLAERRKWDICENDAYAIEHAEHPDPDGVELTLTERVLAIARDAGAMGRGPVAVMTPTWLVIAVLAPDDDEDAPDEYELSLVRRSDGLVVLD